MESETDLYSRVHEQAIVASLIANGSLVNKVIEILPSHEMFGDQELAGMYKCILDLVESSRTVDLVNFAAQHGKYRPSQYLEGFKMFYEQNPATGQAVLKGENIEEYARIVLEKHIKRSIVYQFSQGNGLLEVMGNIARLEQSGANKFFSPREIAVQLFNDLTNPQAAIKYPYKMLNGATRGMHKSQMVIIAARPSVGKTMFLENLAMRAIADGKKVLFVSAEMSATDLGKRFISRYMGRNIFYDESKLIDDPKFHEAVNRFDQSTLYIHELGRISEMEAKIRECHRDFDLVLVDYLQIIMPVGRFGSSYEKVTAISQQLKQMSLRYHLPMVVAAQYNRATENEQPSLANLKDSGQIEQDADVVISLWNKKEDRTDVNGMSKIRVDILKNRNGYKVVGSDGDESFLWSKKDLFTIYDTVKKESRQLTTSETKDTLTE